MGGGAPIGAEGIIPTFRGKERRGNNLETVVISHILLLSRLYTNVNALSSSSRRVGRGASRRQLFNKCVPFKT